MARSGGRDPVTSLERSPVKIALAIALLIGALAAIKLVYDRYHNDYVVEQNDDRAAIDGIVQTTFSKTSALKVATLSGTEQVTARDVRMGGWLTSAKVVKVPFTVDYFVDLGALGPRRYRYDERSRRLTVEIPDVTVAPANVDESRMTINQTSGVWVTRGAEVALARTVSAKAQANAQTEGRKAEHLAAARESARRGLSTLLSGALAAAKQGDVEVAIVFPFERKGDGEIWDMTRSIPEVLGNRS